MIDWNKISKKPLPGKSYLIRSEIVGPVYDVAFYNGVLPGGTDWWTLSNTELNAKAITHWAEIGEPE